MVGKSKEKRYRAADSQVTNECFEYDRNSAMILNEDCLLQIFEYLPITDRIRIERVNKRWRSVSLASWRSFKKLNFTRDTWGYFDRLFVTTKILKKVLARCSNYITDLDMSDYLDIVNSISMNVIMKKCLNLTSIDFSSFEVNPKLLKTLSDTFTKLEKLVIAGCTRTVDDDLIQSTISTLKNLKVLKLKNLALFDWHLPAANSNIEELHFERCDAVESPFTEHSGIDKLPKLHTLSLRGTFYYWDNTLKFLNLTNIKVLDISDCSAYVNDSILAEVATYCSNLQSLDLSYNDEVTDVGLAAIITSNLEHLRINSLYRVFGSSLTNLPSLKSLSCCDCFNLRKNFVEEILKKSNALNYLELANCPKVPREDLFEDAKRILADSRQNDTILKIDYPSEKLPTYRRYASRLQVLSD